MKKLVELPLSILFLIVMVSCTKDSPNSPKLPVFSGGNPGEKNDNYATGLYFGFLDGDGSSNTYIDMPIESSSSNLLVGRWIITKLGIDENNDGNIRYFEFQDFDHKDCGLSFLQFNNNGVVYENSYYNDNVTCTLYSEIDEWELNEANKLNIYVYDNIYLIDVSQSELILKYDWRFENSLYGPMQVYYYFERILESS
ncbi:lipocalin family protein [Arenibacter sp. BSSL-BM3]|uniref:Lipocalin family protein n=1 Tax=Arenibacter arenosicollis TaxID=2762274 RepID=A0ABR7QQ47_9FLAO|nr:lipocalin family protein [Arenibacter arenosicollis]MBC8769314.1 lipocalin family protein [Arenibacter arenosicollis]